MRALPIWILAKQRLSLCLHKYFLIATSVTFFFFQFSLIILIWQMILVFFSYKDANTNSNQCAYCVPSNFLSTCCELTLHVLVHLLLTSVLQMGKLRKEVHSLSKVTQLTKRWSASDQAHQSQVPLGYPTILPESFISKIDVLQ